MSFSRHTRNSTLRLRRRNERGYILLTLLLTVGLMIIFAAAIVPSITFEIKRDREEEMIHRGVQYARAVKAYYKKFGKYPSRIEDLESSNNQRFLRKRYKDPLTGQDFKLLHFSEVKLSLNGGGLIPGVNAIGTPAGGLNGPGGLGQGSTIGGGPLGQNSAFGGSSAFGANSNSAFGQSPQNAQSTGTDPSQNSGGSSNSSSPPGTGNQTDAQNTGVTGHDQPGGQAFGGGGPVVGVVSSCKKDTIREFNHKKKYNEWQFIYDPGADRGGLLMTPNQPSLAGAGLNPPNLNGQGNNGSSSFGGSSFGSSGLQNNGSQNNSSSPGGFGTQPPQQQ